MATRIDPGRDAGDAANRRASAGRVRDDHDTPGRSDPSDGAGALGGYERGLGGYERGLDGYEHGLDGNERGLDGYERGLGATTRAAARALAMVDEAATVVLVEGISDQIAVATAAAGRGRDLAAERVVVVPIGGAHATGRFLSRLGPLGVRLVGLCDRGEEEIVRRSLAAAGIGTPRTRADMARLGFWVCVEDLEDELIRAVGLADVEELFAAQGDLRAFRSFQSQPAWRQRDTHAQMYRFVRSNSHRNLRYARLLVRAAIARGTLPPPIEALLAAL